jgi:hypothetical protein
MEALAVRIIDGTPAALHRLTDDLTPEQCRALPAAGEWSIVEIAGHLIDKTEVWGERFRRIAREDRPVLEAFDQDAWVSERGYASAALPELLATLERLCATLAADLRALPDSSWARQGTHTERGVITLREGVRLYAISLPEHVEQLVRTRDAVLSQVALAE